MSDSLEGVDQIDKDLELQHAEDNFESYKYSEECEINNNNLQTFENGYVQIRTIYADKDGYIWDLYERKEEWGEVDALVAAYQKQFNIDCTDEDKEAAGAAGNLLINKFYPLFKKYLTVLKTGQMNFQNAEQKLFVRLFMDQGQLKAALCRKKIAKELREIIITKFNFIIEAYGAQEDEEITEDLHMLFFVLAKRYKPMGKSFCCYVYNTFKFEVARHVKNYQKNPANFHYKVTCIDNHTQAVSGGYDTIEDSIYEDSRGIPDMSWVSGRTCSELFAEFSAVERKIFCKYYLEDWNDSQIAELLGIHINTANQKRKAIVIRLSEKLGIDINEVKRHRKSGKKAIRTEA